MQISIPWIIPCVRVSKNAVLKKRKLGNYAWVHRWVVLIYIPDVFAFVPERSEELAAHDGIQAWRMGKISRGGYRALNCKMPSDRAHSCWRPAERLLNDGDGLTIESGCGAGSGSILAVEYHAVIRGGQLIIDSATDRFLRFFKEGML